MSFGYIAVRHQSRSWLITGAIYLALAATGFALAATAPDSGNGGSAQSTVGAVILIVLWPAGFVHALWVNFSVWLPLELKAQE